MGIQLRRVSKTFSRANKGPSRLEVSALRGITLDIADGELVAIMGPSGSGKTTLMNILGCLDVPSTGTYHLDGQNVGQLTDQQRALIRAHSIGFVFQQYNLLPRCSAIEQVELPIMYAGGHRRRERALDALAAVGLADRAHHKPTELSGGEQQRIAIARALVNRPSIILADEPTGALDTCTGLQIMATFQGLNRERRLTVILVTHDREIAYHARRVIRLRDGRIEGDDMVDEYDFRDAERALQRSGRPAQCARVGVA